MRDAFDGEASPASASSDSDSMYPAANVPAQTSNMIQPSELQEHIPSHVRSIADRDVVMHDNDTRYAPSATRAVPSAAIRRAMDEDEEGMPGYVWKNKRAVEEARKTIDVMLDKEFTLSWLSSLSWSCAD